ncbi:hypothetical protein CBL_20032 [Carabus blaptoides fortunei]
MNRKKEKGVDTCAVKTCKNLRGRDDITFFRFPLNLERCKLWINASNREDLEGKESRFLYENCRVCSKHITAAMFCSEKKKRINAVAIPALFLNTAQSLYPSASTSQCQMSSSRQDDFLQSTISIQQEQPSTTLFDQSFPSTSSIIHPITCSTPKRKAESEFSGIEKLNTTVKAGEIKAILFEAIMKLKSVGLFVKGFVSDMGSNFIDLSKTLEVTVKDPYFNVDNEKIFYV